MNWKTELGQQLKSARRDCLLRQEDVRDRANVHLNMIGRYERGESAPELDVLIRLASVLELQEIQIGDHIVLIKPQKVEATRSEPKQLRLQFGKEYIFDEGNSMMKIQPSKEGLLIVSEKRKIAS